MNRVLFLLLPFLFLACSREVPNQFSKEALHDVFITTQKKNIEFKEILSKYKGKKILISVWASWCPDCIEALPEEEKLQQEFKDVIYLHLSLDRSFDSWLKGIKRLEVKGEHYLIQSGWKGAFGNFLNLGWIPRYMVINEKGKIVLFKATRPTDKLIKQSLEK
ncbi:hypothetical protein WH52_12580 [Tenacibaculum holothuriorum]|uniref:Thioredoxin domain-containing protein n=1 Tax=Tenacibaculum holothuriorum TaxID=1635173 RepID=A0A1Y2PBX5_9FLAO|nr:TlpA disulfide reductase family protein [Tenacibaculum holothuriorum]OSY87287.1 hypothetical protein WH52_12580 [Tenacibaculum holothuriorum]